MGATRRAVRAERDPARRAVPGLGARDRPPRRPGGVGRAGPLRGRALRPAAALERGLVTERRGRRRRRRGRTRRAPAWRRRPRAPSRPSRRPSRGRPSSGRGRRSPRFGARSWTPGTRRGRRRRSARRQQRDWEAARGEPHGHRGGHGVDLGAHHAAELLPGGVEGPADDRPGLPRAARAPRPLGGAGRAAGGMEGRAHGPGDPAAVRDARARHGVPARERPPRQRRRVPARRADRARLRERALPDRGGPAPGARRHAAPRRGPRSPPSSRRSRSSRGAAISGRTCPRRSPTTTSRRRSSPGRPARCRRGGSQRRRRWRSSSTGDGSTTPSGARTPATPSGAVAWLANKLAEFGRRLEAGHRIMSGSFTKQYPIARGDRIETRFTPFGAVRARRSTDGALQERAMSGQRFWVPACALLVALGAVVEAQPKRVARVAYLAAVSAAADAPRLEAFRQGLRELGYIEGQNLILDYRHEGSGFEPAAGSGRRADPAEARRARRRDDERRPGREEGHHDDPHRVHGRDGPGDGRTGARVSRGPGATRRASPTSRRS